MHLLVDIRTREPSDLIYQVYGQSWVKLWKEYHPHDTITYLVNPGTSITENSICISGNFSIFGGKKIAHHKNGPDRVISFSKFSPIDTSIPTITHIFDNADILYPRIERGFFRQKQHERSYRGIMKTSRHIIVPDIEIGMELVEMFDIPEDRISVIPYFIPSRSHNPFQLLHTYGITPGYWIAEGGLGSEWNPFQLLQAYSQYIHHFNGTKRLVILGNLGENLGYISECIRGLDILEYVKIVGTLPETEQETLYEYASGWISIGGYYGAGPHIASAVSYGLPILSSDIAPIRNYADLTIHPNHTEELTEKLILLSKLHTSIEKYTHSPHATMEAYARVITA